MKTKTSPKRNCMTCGKFLAKDNTTAVYDKDCFYRGIYWGTKKEPGIFVTHPLYVLK